MEALGTNPQIGISLCNYSLCAKRAGKKSHDGLDSCS